MGKQELIRTIEKPELHEKVRQLKSILGPSSDVVFKLAEPISEYDEYGYKSSPDFSEPDRTLVKILFENGTSAVMYIDSQSHPPKLLKAFKATKEGISIITPRSEKPVLHEIQFSEDNSEIAIRRLLRELRRGTPVKPITRYVAPPSKKVS